MKFALYGCASPSKTMTIPFSKSPSCTGTLDQLTLQPLQPRFPQSILRQHPTDCPLQHLPPSPFPHHPLHIQTLQRARPRSLLIVQLLLHFLARSIHIGAAGGDDVVSAVGGGVPDWFVLPHKNDGDLGGEAAEGCGAGTGEGDVVPGSGVG